VTVSEAGVGVTGSACAPVSTTAAATIANPVAPTPRTFEMMTARVPGGETEPPRAVG
jgi:hypothetical protein